MGPPRFDDAQKLADAKALAAMFKKSTASNDQRPQYMPKSGPKYEPSTPRSRYTPEARHTYASEPQLPAPSQMPGPANGPPPPSQRNYVAFGKFGDQPQANGIQRAFVIGSQGLDFLRRTNDFKGSADPSELLRSCGYILTSLHLLTHT